MEELKIYDDGTFDVKFLEAKKTDRHIIVKVESPFGLDTFRISSSKDYLHPTGIKKWKLEVIESLNRKYGKNFKNTQVFEENLLDTEEVVKSK